MRRLFAGLMAAGLAAALAGCGAGAQQAKAGGTVYAMDTVMNFTYYDGDNGNADAAYTQTQQEINRLDQLLSRTRASSEISKLNSAGGAPTQVDGEVADVISDALTYSAATDGTFDITIAPVVSAWGFTTDHQQVPEQSKLEALLKTVDYRKVSVDGDTVTLGPEQSVDLGGIAKGYASDRVKAILEKNGVASAMASLGGNVYVRGSKPDGSAWRVAVEDPKNTSAYAGVLSLTESFAVTSGGYQRYFVQDGKTYHHIIDPSTGAPSESGLTSVTIISGENGTMCDAFSTALFVMGEQKAINFWRTGGYNFEMVLITADGRVLVSEGVADRFEQEKSSGYTYEVIPRTAP